MNSSEKIKIFEKGLQQRKLVLKELQTQITFYEQQSDMGWMLTMGAQEFGMLMAIDSNQKYREAQKIQTAIIEEIRIIQQTIIQLKQR